jgi:toxin-antitoxin system PIN domain toxin
MSPYLLDINVLVALFWTNHEHHEAAIDWFRRRQKAGWATCPLTQAGFVRVSSNPRVFPDAPSPAKAVEILQANLKHPAHRFFKDEIGFPEAVKRFSGAFSGHQQVTDAYLFGLAVHRGGVFTTFDTSVSALAAEDSSLLKSLEILGS